MKKKRRKGREGRPALPAMEMIRIRMAKRMQPKTKRKRKNLLCQTISNWAT